MNRKEGYFGHIENNMRDNLSLMRKKNQDYAGDNDPLKNFRLCEQLDICPVEVGMMVRITDKVSRLSNLLRSPNLVEDEKITDTLNDLSNYALIMKAYIEEEQWTSKWTSKWTSTSTSNSDPLK